MRHVISALVENTSGVLAHVAGLFSSRGFNIDSLTVGRTENPNISRMTIVVTGDDAILEQVRKQLGKLINVLKITDFEGKDIVQRELGLIRVTTPSGKRQEIIGFVEIFKGKVVDISVGEMMIEISGPEAKLDAFIEMMKPFGIREMVRTGVVALARGEGK